MSNKLHQLYRHWSSDGTLLYVGISVSAMGRLSQHKTSAKWYELITNVTIENYNSREELLHAEEKAIKSEKPIYNKRHNGKVLTKCSGITNVLTKLMLGIPQQISFKTYLLSSLEIHINRFLEEVDEELDREYLEMSDEFYNDVKNVFEIIEKCIRHYHLTSKRIVLYIEADDILDFTYDCVNDFIYFEELVFGIVGKHIDVIVMDNISDGIYYVNDIEFIQLTQNIELEDYDDNYEIYTEKLYDVIRCASTFIESNNIDDFIDIIKLDVVSSKFSTTQDHWRLKPFLATYGFLI